MSWPEPAGSVLAELEARLRDLLGPNLRGMYVYGSLAFGCYNPARSDVDVLVVTRRRLAAETRPAVSSFLRRLAAAAKLEISFLSRADLEPWRYPTPYDLHFGNSGGVKEDGEAVYFAAEIVTAREHGVALAGPPPPEALPAVPEADYLDCIVRDVAWARDRLAENPVYAVLNCCRVLAYKRDRTILSKAEGGEWGLRELPERFTPLVRRATRAYTGDEQAFEPGEVAAFVEWASAEIG